MGICWDQPRHRRKNCANIINPFIYKDPDRIIKPSYIEDEVDRLDSDIKYFKYLISKSRNKLSTSKSSYWINHWKDEIDKYQDKINHHEERILQLKKKLHHKQENLKSFT